MGWRNLVTGEKPTSHKRNPSPGADSMAIAASALSHCCKCSKPLHHLDHLLADSTAMCSSEECYVALSSNISLILGTLQTSLQVSTATFIGFEIKLQINKVG